MNRLLCLVLSAWLCGVVHAAGQALTTTREERGSIAAAAAALSHQPVLRLSARAQGGGSRPCGQTMLIGLGVGAGVGATIGGLAWRSFDQPAAGFAATTGVLGLLGLAVGYKLCRCVRFAGSATPTRADSGCRTCD